MQNATIAIQLQIRRSPPFEGTPTSIGSHSFQLAKNQLANVSPATKLFQKTSLIKACNLRLV